MWFIPWRFIFLVPQQGGYPGQQYGGYGQQQPGGYPGQFGGYAPPPQQAAVSPEIQNIFRNVDKDNSGKINSLELQAALINGRGDHFSDTACNMMIGMFDRDRSGTIDIYEFEKLYNYINQWLQIFKTYDRDASGHIEEAELSQGNCLAMSQGGHPMLVAGLLDFWKPEKKSSEFGTTDFEEWENFQIYREKSWENSRISLFNRSGHS